ncbi:dipeptide/oligopeptide/nickel ABC transporter ATP-binding protein [Desulfobacula sp.]|uniref:ABC transporter ATP-binding protein n=1 Tax=Desulfobacula sp. TaxID=2593537 RepID=UPI0025BA09F1|nr:dipeptide/oligopeptide/nickel ABC transporter ATP-binding protein [Desulfobacula sp.]MBC2705744.1 ABC transporter ATP-binding protein [Desulfobacula sp.]
MLLKAVKLKKSFNSTWFKTGETPAVVDAGFSLNPGETIGIVGKSGAGKTTLGLMLAGVIKPDFGQIFYKGEDIWALTRRKRRRMQQHIQMIFQHPESTFNPKWKISRSLMEPCRLHKMPVSEDTIIKWAERVGLAEDVLYRYPMQLSGGELQRIAIARAMSISPAILVLDEPVSMLDTSTKAQIIRVIKKIQASTCAACIFISHDVDIARLICNRMYKLENHVLR